MPPSRHGLDIFLAMLAAVAVAVAMTNDTVETLYHRTTIAIQRNPKNHERNNNNNKNKHTFKKSNNGNNKKGNTKGKGKGWFSK